jgi:hypothetical protein
MSPFSLSDDELSELMHLAEAVPVEHRDAFLQSVVDAISKYPEVGVGLIHREAARLQRAFVTAPSRYGPGCHSKYR